MSKNGKTQTKAKAASPEIKIDPEFKSLIIPQTREESVQLERNLIAEGRCRNRLVVWKGHEILLDGHHRLELCKKLVLPYEIFEIELADREAAMNWIRDNQLGRRNLTAEAVSYLRGQHYNAEKKPHGGDRKSEESSGNGCHSKTEQVLAEHYKVASKTIRNDAVFAAAIDKITKTCGDDFKNALLHHEVKINRSQIEEVAEIEDHECQKETVSKVLESRRMPKANATEGAAQSKVGVASLDKVTVPTNPIEMAKGLLRRFGPRELGKIQEAIVQVLAEHQAKQKGDKAQGKTKRRKKASRKSG